MSAHDYARAAEMFRAAEQLEPRRRDAYEKASSFAEAAECYGAGGRRRTRQAQLLEKAGDSRSRRASCSPSGRDRRGDPPAAAGRARTTRSYGDACAMLGRMFQEKGMHSLSVKKLEQATRARAVDARQRRALLRARVPRTRSAGDLRGRDRDLREDPRLRLPLQRRRAAARARKRAAAREAAPRTAPPQTRSARPRRSQQRYEIVREIGRGGMGVVYLARDSVLEREVAYKVLPEQLRENPDALQGFLREAKAAAQLNHPNIVTVYDAGESEHGFYMAMELVEGTTLKEIAAQRGPIAPGGVIYMLRQMARGARLRARQEGRAPRHQDREHDVDRRQAGEDHGLRPGEADGGGAQRDDHDLRHARSTCPPSRRSGATWTTAPTCTRSA